MLNECFKHPINTCLPPPLLACILSQSWGKDPRRFTPRAVCCQIAALEVPRRYLVGNSGRWGVLATRSSTPLGRVSLQGRRHPPELSSAEESGEGNFTAGEMIEQNCQFSLREVTHEQGRGQMLPAQLTVRHTELL